MNENKGRNVNNKGLTFVNKLRRNKLQLKSLATHYNSLITVISTARTAYFTEEKAPRCRVTLFILTNAALSFAQIILYNKAFPSCVFLPTLPFAQYVKIHTHSQKRLCTGNACKVKHTALSRLQSTRQACGAITLLPPWSRYLGHCWSTWAVERTVTLFPWIRIATLAWCRGREV